MKREIEKKMSDAMGIVFEKSGMVNRPPIMTLDEMKKLAEFVRGEVASKRMMDEELKYIRGALVNLISVGTLLDKPLETYGHTKDEFSPLFDQEKKSSLILN